MLLPSWNRCFLAIAIFGAVVASPAWGHPNHDEPPRVFASVEQFRPTPLPDRVVVSWSEDPATTIDVTYRTDVATTRTVCQWIAAAKILGDHNTGDILEAASVEGTSEPFTSDLGEALIHTVKLRSLESATRYAYRVGDSANWSEWHHVTTASKAAASGEVEPFEFLYFGDAQNAVRALWSRVRREAHAEAPRAAFALHAGDLINNQKSDAEWGEWHGAAGWLNATVPTVAVPGNHEYHVVDLKPTVSAHWRPQFSFPTNGLKGLEETSYWFNYQGARFVALNSNERQEEQAEWLDRLLTDEPKTQWTIVTFHHPIFSAAKNRDNPTLRAMWKAVFDKHGVDLALTGHDHTYARSGLGGPTDSELVGTENVGEGLRGKVGKTVYVVSVSGPKMYPLGDAWEVSRNASGLQLYQVIGVDQDAIRYQAFSAAGDLYDAFTLHKNSEGEVELEEQTPPTPPIHK